jgi:DNA-binding LacI/PurR family transcriptional regulator
VPTEVNMRAVAEQAGVSPATVSRVLNGLETVREDYRVRVLAAVAELEYRPRTGTAVTANVNPALVNSNSRRSPSRAP